VRALGEANCGEIERDLEDEAGSKRGKEGKVDLRTEKRGGYFEAFEKEGWDRILRRRISRCNGVD